MRIKTPLCCEHIILRNLETSDATPVYLGWLSDPAINAYLEVRFSPQIKIGDLAEFIDDANGSLHTLMLGIFLQQGSRHIGNIKLGPIDWNHKVGDIGFLLGDKDQWGKGYASKAITLVANYAFKELGLAKLTAGCYAGNEGSRRALLKANFVEEGRRISQWLVANYRQDGILMGLVNHSVASPQQSHLT